MDQRNATARSDSANMNSASLRSASCAKMTVAYAADARQLGCEKVRAEIAIVIPGDQAILHASYLTGDGQRHRTFVRAPYVSVIPARQPHTLDCECAADLVLITLEQEFFEAKARAALDGHSPALIERYAALDPFLRETGNLLRHDLRTVKFPSDAYLDDLAGVVAVHLAAHYAHPYATRDAVAGLPPHKLHRVRTYIDEHINEALSVVQLAEIVHLSRYHFARMFKKSTGHSPHLYVTVKRIDRAKTLLIETTMRLIDIGAAVGFQTQGHFTEVFHRFTGQTPRAFRVTGKVRLPIQARRRGDKGRFAHFGATGTVPSCG